MIKLKVVQGRFTEINRKKLCVRKAILLRKTKRSSLEEIKRENNITLT